MIFVPISFTAVIIYIVASAIMEVWCEPAEEKQFRKDLEKQLRDEEEEVQKANYQPIDTAYLLIALCAVGYIIFTIMSAVNAEF